MESALSHHPTVEWALAAKTRTRTERAALVEIVKVCDWSTGRNSWQSQDRIAKMIRRHRRTVIRLINSLCQQGFIERDGKHGRFRRLRVLFTPDLVARCHTEPVTRSRSRSKAKVQRRTVTPPPSLALAPDKHTHLASYLVVTRLVHVIEDDADVNQRRLTAHQCLGELAGRMKMARMTPTVGMDLSKLIAAVRARRRPPSTPHRVLQRLAHVVLDDVEAGTLLAEDAVEEFKCRIARARLACHWRDVRKPLAAAEFQRRRRAA